jgi:hypothetical protein
MKHRNDFFSNLENVLEYDTWLTPEGSSRNTKSLKLHC